MKDEKELKDLKALEQERTLEALKRYTDDETDDDKDEISLKSIFGGDILQSRFMLKQILWVVVIVVLMIVYTANRYSAQQDIIRIAQLREQLQEVKYKVLTQSSELMNLTRQSNVERHLKQTNDSTLLNPTSPPYLIR